MLDKVFPLIKLKCPDAKLWIVGQHIPEKITKRKSKYIFVDDLGYDDEDGIRKAYFESSVFVSPLWGPGGTRLKHFAAMASCLPLVTTSVGAEGLEAKNGFHILVEDDLSKMAEAAVRILKEPLYAKRLAQNARNLVKEKFSWQIVADKLDRLYRDLSVK